MMKLTFSLPCSVECLYKKYPRKAMIHIFKQKKNLHINSRCTAYCKSKAVNSIGFFSLSLTKQDINIDESTNADETHLQKCYKYSINHCKVWIWNVMVDKSFAPGDHIILTKLFKTVTLAANVKDDTADLNLSLLIFSLRCWELEGINR